jgi:hypothetical protein
MRSAPLTTIKGGIDRRRLKGGARADVLYDLLNGYVNDSGMPVSRPGTSRSAKLDPLTRGLCAYDGTIHVFCHKSVYVPAGYTLHLVVHPDIVVDDVTVTDGETIAIDTIHFAQPFMGALYVVAEFENGNVYHYWLQSGATWEASTVYDIGDFVIPTIPNGLVYRASRLGSANPVWAPDVLRYDGTFGSYYDVSVVEPTTYNGYHYTCIATTGSDPRSGTTEPTWPVVDGETVTERADNPADDTTPATIDTTTSSATPSTATRTRYGKLSLAGWVQR